MGVLCNGCNEIIKIEDAVYTCTVCQRYFCADCINNGMCDECNFLIKVMNKED